MNWKKPVYIIFPDPDYEKDEVNDFGDITKVFDNEESAKKFIDEQRGLGYHYDYAIRELEI
jgi:hypothetical protein